MLRHFLMLTAACLVLGLAVAACGGDDDDSSDDGDATATATSPEDESPTEGGDDETPTEPADDTPTEEPPAGCPLSNGAACTLAMQIEDALIDGDAGAILALLEPDEATCPEPSDAGGPDPTQNICEGHDPGDVVEGYVIGARRSDAIGYVTAAQFEEYVDGLAASDVAEATDDAGSGAFQLTTVSEQDGYTFAYTWIQLLETTRGEVFSRGLLEVGVEPEGDDWVLRYFWSGGIIGDIQLLDGRGSEGLEPWSPGGEPLALPEVPILFGEAYTVANTDGECLNVREAPGTDAAIVVCLDEGAFLIVIGGPEESGERTWWQVDHNGPAGQFTGWVAEEFLGPLG